MAKRETALQLWGREFALARTATAMSQDALANSTYMSSSLIGMWELGKRAPKLEDLARCEECLGTNGLLERLLTKWVSREVSPQWFGRWRSAEEEATTLLSFQPTVVPGLLQTKEYAQAVLEAGVYYRTDVEEMVAVRLERQKILERDDPPFLVALLDESVLRRNVGGSKVMADQLLHVARMAARKDVVVQVIPFTASAGAGFLSPFVIASFDDRREVAYVDNQVSGEVLEDPIEVGLLRQVFERFRADAMSRQASIDFIREVAAEQWQVA